MGLLVSEHRAHRILGRHTHWRPRQARPLAGARRHDDSAIGDGWSGLLAGLSDDDPAGITTYSILGAKYGYELLWVLALATAALIVFPRARSAAWDRHRQRAADVGPRALRPRAAGLLLLAQSVSGSTGRGAAGGRPHEKRAVPQRDTDSVGGDQP